MFGTLPHFSTLPPPTEPPKNVPPSTPVRFPRCYPLRNSDAAAASTPADGVRRRQPLTRLLQSIIRPTEIRIEHFEALGVHVRPDATLADLIPDPSFIPDFAAWDATTYEDARSQNEQTRHLLCNDKLSPGVQTYLDRKRELAIDNNAAFRSVRRIQPQKGQPLVRLGNAYEFFRQLESFTTFWDDTSAVPPPPPPTSSRPAGNPATTSKIADGAAKANGAEDGDGDGDGDSVSSASSAAVTDSEGKAPEKDSTPPEIRFYRTSTGSQMPPEFRLNILTAFLKLIAYDFGCNVAPPRMEPRLYLNAGSLPTKEAKPKEEGAAPPKRKSVSSYFTSGCIFIFRMAQTREAARAGIVEGPLAAVSARHTTTFPDDTEGCTDDEKRALWSEDKDACIDLARELVAALLTAQQRARGGRTERRLGEGEWWASKPRWGGSSGGPIGREVDAAPNTDEDIADRGEGSGHPVNPAGAGSRSSAPPIVPSSRAGASGFRGGMGGMFSGGMAGQPLPSRSAAKKARKGLAIYDNYRMVRPPSSNWDKKTRYQAIGRAAGADYDDVFVVSALFHHLSIVRVRVPIRLLAALDGDESDTAGVDAAWGRLEMVRSPWYDMFKADDRVAAMQLVWAMMAYLMRKQGADVPMGNAA